MQDSQEEITGLLDRSRNHDDNDEEFRSREQKPASRRSNLPLAIIAILSILLAVDIASYTYIARLLFSQVPVDDLEYKSSYVGLDELYKFGGLKPAHYDRLLNMPRTAVQVYRDEPDKSTPPGTHQWLSNFGTLAPPDRHLHVSENVHTLLQFRVLDFGMEKCTLVLRLPALGEHLPHPYVLGDGSSSNISLDVSQLGYTRTLSEHVTWNSKPRRQKDVAILRGTGGSEFESESFPCMSGAHLTFELSCAREDPNCLVDVWSNQNATWGVFMYQYQTL